MADFFVGRFELEEWEEWELLEGGAILYLAIIFINLRDE